MIADSFSFYDLGLALAGHDGEVPRSCTNGEFARLYGCSERHAASLKATGRLPLTEGGKIDFRAILLGSFKPEDAAAIALAAGFTAGACAAAGAVMRAARAGGDLTPAALRAALDEALGVINIAPPPPHVLEAIFGPATVPDAEAA